LWWEFWPEQDARAELDGSLQRMGFDYVDLIYANPPPGGLPIAEMVTAIAELLSSGKARAWAIVNWDAGPFLEASRAASELGVAQPCAAQLPYSLVNREWVEGAEMARALAASGAGVVASFVMAGGVLTGKYERGGSGRASAELEDPRHAAARKCAVQLRALADEVGVSAGALAIAFALRNRDVATVLFGATSGEQIAANVAALELDDDVLARIAELSLVGPGGDLSRQPAPET
jgi:aryl-alcohol dehydrogenase-like predicted oxidoreductase